MEEIEFRFALGEFDYAETKTRLKAVDKQVADTAAVREQAEAMKQRFVAVFRSEEELEQAAPPPPAGATRKMSTLAAADAGSAYDTIPPTPAPIPLDKSEPMATKVMAVPPTAPGASPGATQMMRAVTPQEMAAAAGKTPPPAAPRGDSTMIMRTARLVPQNPDAGKQNHTLALKPTVIGNADGCEVRVSSAIPRHAEIRVSMAGFTLSDEGGGVRVNGVAVNQHLLRHEDVVEVGSARFVFREG
jgi:hypothetical protein